MFNGQDTGSSPIVTMNNYAGFRLGTWY